MNTPTSTSLDPPFILPNRLVPGLRFRDRPLSGQTLSPFNRFFTYRCVALIALRPKRTDFILEATYPSHPALLSHFPSLSPDYDRISLPPASLWSREYLLPSGSLTSDEWEDSACPLGDARQLRPTEMVPQDFLLVPADPPYNTILLDAHINEGPLDPDSQSSLPLIVHVGGHQTLTHSLLSIVGDPR